MQLNISSIKRSDLISSPLYLTYKLNYISFFLSVCFGLPYTQQHRFFCLFVFTIVPIMPHFCHQSLCFFSDKLLRKEIYLSYHLYPVCTMISGHHRNLLNTWGMMTSPNPNTWTSKHLVLKITCMSHRFVSKFYYLTKLLKIFQYSESTFKYL